MTEQPPGHELEFIELLAMYDESLAAGDVASMADTDLPESLLPDAELLKRFEKLRDCLHLLETDRRQQQLNGVDPLIDSQVIEPEPQRIGRFRILRKLGAGGFGIVYLAEDPILQRKIAIKIPRRETLMTPDLQRRFVRESQIAARLTHRHLVPIFDAGQAGAISYQVTAYCGGGSLAEWLRVERSSANAQLTSPMQRRLPVNVAVELMIGLAEGVHFAHEHGILHRDLKPANILLQPRVERDSGSPAFDASSVPGEQLCAMFQPMIADFGLAKLFDTQDDLSTSAMPIMDHDLPSDFQRTTLAGTPQYMAPEQISADTRMIGKRTDIYGLGSILYEILTGTPVFAKDSVENLRSRIETEPPRHLRELRPEIPRDLEAICLKCLEKSPTARYATAQELVDDLRALQKGEPVAARPWPWHEQIAKWTRRRPAVAALLLISSVLTMGLMGFGAWHLNQLDSANQQLRETIDYLAIQTDKANLQSRRSEKLQWIASQREYAARMMATSQLSQQGKKGETCESLRSLDSDDSRDFAWRYLWDQNNSLQFLRGHDGAICIARLTPDGQVCYSVANDGTVRKWDVPRARLLKTWSLGERPARHLVQFDRSASRAIIRRGFLDEEVDEVIIWDLRNGQAICRKEFSYRAVESVAINVDGTLVALKGKLEAPDVPSIWLWDPDTDEMTVKVFSAAKDPEISAFRTSAIAFSPQDQDLVGGIHYVREGVYWSQEFWRARIELSEQVVSAGHRTSPTITRLEQWKPRIAGEEFNIVVSDDGQRVALATDDPPRIEILDWKNGTLIANIADLPAFPRTMAFEPSGAALVYTIDVPAPTENGQPASPGNPRTGPPVFELRRSDFVTNSSETLISDAVRNIWSLSPAEGIGEPIDRSQHSDHAKSTTSRWVIGDEGGLISLWSPESAPPYRELTGHQPREAWGVAFSPDGSRLYSVGDDTCLRVWNSTTLEETAVRKEHTALVSCLAVSPDGSWIATGSYDNRAIIWNAKTLEPHAVLTGHTNQIKSLAFASDSKTLATAARDETIKLWNVADGQLTTTTEPDGATTLGMVFTSANSFISGNFKGFLFARSPDRKPEIIRTEWQEIHCLSIAPVELQCPAPPANSAEASEDATLQILTAGKGELLLVGCRHGRFQLLHLPTRRVWFEHSYPGIDIRTVAFSPDGRNFAVAGDDKAVHIWHTATGEEILTFADLPAEVNQVAFSPDGQMLAAALHNGTIRIWRAPAP